MLYYNSIVKNKLDSCILEGIFIIYKKSEKKWQVILYIASRKEEIEISHKS